ncbi:MATE family efflux transporter [Hymenobacter humi]|uniref:MATE family efflux transporter n=1 Tax=Hymenobacter humi TaxID=1411620 RepID=A0ABW2U7G1_9BACT
MENLRPHLRPTLLLAFPVMLSQLGHVLVNFVDSVVVGHIGKVPLAAVGVGVSTTSVLLVLGVGLSMGTVPLVAAADGRRDVPELGRLLVASVWMSALAGLVLAGVGQRYPPFCTCWGSRPRW